jgi:two-component system nitrate/nitrite response regulator NarL
MILVCSPETNVRQRWLEGLKDASDIQELDSMAALEQSMNGGDVELVLLHLTLPGLNGVQGVTALRRKYPKSLLLVFSNIPEENEGIILFSSGVSGYANTYMSPSLLTEAVKIVLMGEIWVGKKLMQRIIGNLAHLNRQQEVPDAPEKLSLLTDRERQVASLLAEGASNKVIAQQTGVTERTVKSHLTSIFRKTGTRDRLQLALLLHGHPL